MQVAEEAPDSAATLLGLFEQLKADEDLLDRLTQHGFGRPSADPFGVSRWQQFWNHPHNLDLWRLKAFDTHIQHYRVIYAVFPRTMEHVVLAIVHRDDFDYAADHPVTRRVLEAYERLCSS